MKNFFSTFKEVIIATATILSFLGGILWHNHKYAHREASKMIHPQQYKARDSK